MCFDQSIRNNRPQIIITTQLTESSGSVRDEEGPRLHDAMREGEFELRCKELLDVGSANVGSLFKLDDTENVDGPEAGTMPRSHVLVHGLDSRCTRELTELLVHVVGARARVVADPDTEVLDFQGLLLVDLVDADNFTAGLLDFLQLPQEIPETGLCDDLIRRKDTHAI